MNLQPDPCGAIEATVRAALPAGAVQDQRAAELSRAGGKLGTWTGTVQTRASMWRGSTPSRRGWATSPSVHWSIDGSALPDASGEVDAGGGADHAVHGLGAPAGAAEARLPRRSSSCWGSGWRTNAATWRRRLGASGSSRGAGRTSATFRSWAGVPRRLPRTTRGDGGIATPRFPTLPRVPPPHHSGGIPYFHLNRPASRSAARSGGQSERSIEQVPFV